jgi:OHCU decarboxylase
MTGDGGARPGAATGAAGEVVARDAVVQRLDGMAEEACVSALLSCAGSSRWARAMAARRPFIDWDGLVSTGNALWAALAPADILEAIGHHPRLGDDLEALRRRFAAAQPREAGWSASEQAGARGAPEAVLRALRAGNLRYEQRFGHVFILCAQGRSAEEMLAALEARLDSAPEVELAACGEELRKITLLRLERL